MRWNKNSSEVPHLSMGMTNDYSVAVEEGATLSGSAPPFSVNEKRRERELVVCAPADICPLNFAVAARRTG